MMIDLPTILFYVFATVLVLCAIAVISARNSVHSVFFLILAFFNAAALFVLLGAEYLAMTLVIVYVGAVAVLFLFVVMMLNVNFAALREGFMRNLPLGIGFAAVLFAELASLFILSMQNAVPASAALQAIPAAEQISNAEAIGLVFYTQYLYLFQVAGLILLVAMIGAIVLTLRQRGGVRRQNIARQNRRTREESIAIVQVKPGQGA